MKTVPRPAVYLGLSGIAPPLLCLGVIVTIPGWRWVAFAAGCFYAALILSFLGGMWWMQALEGGVKRPAPYIAAVVPSLLGWAALLPWCIGWPWPGPSLIGLGTALALSPLVDWWLGLRLPVAVGWLSLRWAMASGLGVATLVLGYAAI